MKIAVLGGGHGCYAAAADLSEAGHEVRLWRRDAAALAPVQQGGILLKDQKGPRDVRLALPDGPGVYRMLRISGDVLYVGKATSLHHRVNSYFRKQKGIHERTLEMLSQARDLSFVVTESPLEAALLEPDEIKRHISVSAAVAPLRPPSVNTLVAAT